VKLGGLFLRAPDKNYVLMRLDAEGDHPYAVVYHEYTHLLLSKSAEWMPLWLNEGLAEFYQNSDIHEKDVSLGEPSADNLALLKQSKLLPLATLFTVDEKSPYYHEEDKGSIFYAESWALTHYILFKDRQEKTHRSGDYIDLVQQHVDAVTAATRAFGDLKVLQNALQAYVRQESFHYLNAAISTSVDEAAFQAQALTAAQSEAVRADFLAYNGRTADAQALLDNVLHDDPNNVSALETTGYLEFRQGHLEEARKRYAQAVQLDSQSFLAQYYFAAMSMNGTVAPSDEAQVETSLRAAIKLNPSFAPAYGTLAVFLGMRNRNLEEARRMGLTAVSLDPANVGYRMTVANVLLAMRKGKNAVEVLRNAAKVAKTPEQSQAVANLLTNAQAYAAAQEAGANLNQQVGQEMPGQEQGSTADADVPHLAHRKEFVASGPHHFVVGVLRNVHCDNPNLDLAVTSGAKTLTLHSDNYFKIQFSALGFQPNGDLNPCRDLESKSAKVEYVESADKTDAPHLLAIELHK